MEYYQNMELDATAVRKVLIKKGAEALYHANSVRTAHTFLSEGALVSRRAVEERGLVQSPQSSDALDKRFKIWNDVFVDAVDIHSRIRGRNYYGPVLFVLDLTTLGSPPVRSVLVTRKNPTAWQPGERLTERFFGSIEEFEAGYSLGDFGTMFMLRGLGGVLSLRERIQRIIVDDPGGPAHLPDRNVEVFEPAIAALRSAAHAGGFKRLRIERRQCSDLCGCRPEYIRYPFQALDLYLTPPIV